MNVPSGYTALDLIGFTDRGDYDSTANYVKNDLVHHNNSIWRCLVDDTTAVTPAEGANWTVYIQNGTTLNGMADVNLTTPANGDLLRYNSTSSKWENQDVDSTPTQSSTKLVQSGGVYTQLAGKADTADLATVATTGAYSDLSGAPQLAAVATSGAYSDLTGQPTIPTVNDATLTIQKNGTNVETFTANSSTNKTANITVPDVINDLSDVNISSVANEEILAYDSASSKWKNSGALGALKETLTNEINISGVKNLLPNTRIPRSTTKFGITFTVDDDGVITANGTSTSDGAQLDYSGWGVDGFKISDLKMFPGEMYRLYKGNNDSANLFYIHIYDSNGSRIITYRVDNSPSTVFTMPADAVYISPAVRISKDGTVNNLKIYPMITRAYMDTTYEPYAKTNQQLTQETTGLIDNVNVCGVKNLNNPAQYRGGNNEGITWTVNDDGTVTANGTRTSAESNCPLNSYTFVAPFTAQVVLTGGVSSSHHIYPWDVTTSTRPWEDSTKTTRQKSNSGGYADKVSFYMEEGHIYVMRLRMQGTAGEIVSNEVFKPMLRLASDPDDTYVPYAMSNREITNILDNEIIGNRVITTRNYLRVNADGTKTYKTLLNELATAILAKAGTMADDERLSPIGLYLSRLGAQAPASNAYSELSNTSASVDFGFVAIDLYISDSKNNIRSYYLSSTLSNCASTTMAITPSGNIFTNNTENALASGYIDFYYEILKTV